MRKDRKNIKIDLFKPTFMVLVFAMVAGAIFMAVDVATSGAEISKLGREAEALSQRNRELTQEVIKLSSISVVDESSQTLGFAKPEKTVYLTPQEAVFAKLP